MGNSNWKLHDPLSLPLIKTNTYDIDQVYFTLLSKKNLKFNSWIRSRLANKEKWRRETITQAPTFIIKVVWLNRVNSLFFFFYNMGRGLQYASQWGGWTLTFRYNNNNNNNKNHAQLKAILRGSVEHQIFVSRVIRTVGVVIFYISMFQSVMLWQSWALRPV